MGEISDKGAKASAIDHGSSLAAIGSKVVCRSEAGAHHMTPYGNKFQPMHGNPCTAQHTHSMPQCSSSKVDWILETCGCVGQWRSQGGPATKVMVHDQQPHEKNNARLCSSRPACLRSS
eukprot:1157745-Pelagomonas_calceolata.AAC.10